MPASVMRLRYGTDWFRDESGRAITVRNGMGQVDVRLWSGPVGFRGVQACDYGAERVGPFEFDFVGDFVPLPKGGGFWYNARHEKL